MNEFDYNSVKGSIDMDELGATLLQAMFEEKLKEYLTSNPPADDIIEYLTSAQLNHKIYDCNIRFNPDPESLGYLCFCTLKAFNKEISKIVFKLDREQMIGTTREILEYTHFLGIKIRGEL